MRRLGLALVFWWGVAVGDPPPKKFDIQVSPSVSSVKGCAQIQFTATVKGGKPSDRGVTWSIVDPPLPDGHSLGVINSTGLYTAPDPRPYDSIVVHVAATSVVNQASVGTAEVTVRFSPDRILVIPDAVSLAAGGFQSFTARIYTSCGL